MSAVRYEVKTVCDEAYLPEVRSWIRMHPAALVETYPPRQVNNLYLDTYDLGSAQDNLDGVSQRTKLRFRWYGTDFRAVQGVLELKCKHNQLGWKEHCPIPATFDLLSISWLDWIGALHAHATGSIAATLWQRDQPALITCYVREYYASFDAQIRVTVDHDQAIYDQALHPSPNLALAIPSDRQVTIEVKSAPSLYGRVSDVLSSFPLRPERNSKYVRGLTTAGPMA